MTWLRCPRSACRSPSCSARIPARIPRCARSSPAATCRRGRCASSTRWTSGRPASSASCRPRGCCAPSPAERQLQEVLVDFWFNHFNVFARQGRAALVPDRLRARGDPPARARAVPRPAARDRAASRDALLPRQLAEHAAGLRHGARGPNKGRARRAQRELRARADGAAHARRRRRLHPGRRHRGGAGLHRLDASTAPRQEARFVFRSAARHDHGAQGRPRRGRSRAAASATARRCSICSPGIPRPRASSPASWSAGSWPTIRRRRSSSAWPRAIRQTGRRHLAPCCGRSSPRRSSGPRRGPRQDQEALRVRGQRGARRRRDARRAGRLRAGARVGRDRRAALRGAAAHRLPRPGRGVGQSRDAPGAHELRAGVDRGPVPGVRVDVEALVAGADRQRAGRRARAPAGRADPRRDRRRHARRAASRSSARRRSPGSASTTAAPANTDVSKLAALVLGAPEFQRR